MLSITERHDKILKRLADSIKYGEVSIDKIVPDAPNETGLILLFVTVIKL
jgi:hypothetical protein